MITVRWRFLKIVRLEASPNKHTIRVLVADWISAPPPPRAHPHPILSFSPLSTPSPSLLSVPPPPLRMDPACVYLRHQIQWLDLAYLVACSPVLLCLSLFAGQQLEPPPIGRWIRTTQRRYWKHKPSGRLNPTTGLGWRNDELARRWEWWFLSNILL